MNLNKKSLIFAITTLLIASVSITSISAQSQYEIPAWVKGIAGFWAEDKISDSEFGEGLAFLIDNEIIKIPKIQELENRIVQLENENKQLRSKTNDNSESVPIPVSSVTVWTGKSEYRGGDTIGIAGNVYPILDNVLVTLQIFTDGNLVEIAQIPVFLDGSYFHTLIAEGPLWEESRDYTVRVSYGEGNIAETAFFFDNPERGILGSEHSHAAILVKISGDEFNFSAPAYQIKSSDVHFEGRDGSTIHKHATGVTLGYLFETLSLGLDEKCFVFQDGRSFCSNSDYSLKFYINGEQIRNMNDYEITNNDKILISYGAETQNEVNQQLTELNNQEIIR